MSSANQRSTRFLHELDVGVKWNTTRGRSHLLMAVFCGSRNVEHHVHVETFGYSLVDGDEELLELLRPVLGPQLVDDLPGGEVQGGEQVQRRNWSGPGELPTRDGYDRYRNGGR